MATGNNTPQWQAFCEEVRRILGGKGALRGGHALHLEIKDLAKVKQNLDRYAEFVPLDVYKGLVAEIDNLGREAHQLALDHEAASKLKDKVRLEKAVETAKTFETKISTLREKIEGQIKLSGIPDFAIDGIRALSDWHALTLKRFQRRLAALGDSEYQALVKSQIQSLRQAYDGFLEKVKDTKNKKDLDKLETQWEDWPTTRIDLMDKRAGEIRLQQEQAVRDQSVFRVRLGEAKKLRLQLEQLGNEEDASTVARTVERSEELSRSTPPDWRAAIELLAEELSHASTYKSKAAKLQQSGEKQFEKACELVKTRLQELEALVDVESHQAFKQRFTLAKGQAGAMQKADPLNALSVELALKIQRAKDVKLQADELERRFAKEIGDDVPAYLEPTAFSRILEQRELLKTAIKEKRIEEAIDYQQALYKWIEVEAPELRSSARSALEDSEDVKNALMERLGKVGIAKGDVAGSQTSGEVSLILDRDLAQALKRKEWSLVQTLLDRATSLVDMLESRDALRETHSVDLKERIEEVGTLVLSTRERIKQLKASLDHGMKTRPAPPGTDIDKVVSGVIDPLTSRLEKLHEVWQLRAPHAATLKELEDLGVYQGVEELAKGLADTMPDATLLQTWEGQWRSAYEERAKALEAKLQRLGLGDPLSAVELRSRLERGASDPSKDWEARVASIGDVEIEIKARQDRLQKSLDTVKNLVLTKIGEADGLIRTARSRAGKFTAMIDECKLQVDELRGVEMYTNLAMAQDALDVLEEVVGILNSFENRTGERASLTLEKAWKDVQQQLSDNRAEMRKHAPTRLEALDKSVNKAEEGLFALKPAAFNDRVDGLKQDIAAVMREVEQVKIERTGLEKRANHATERIGLLDFKVAPKFIESLQKRIAEALKAAKAAPDGLSAAKLDIDALHRELDALKKGKGGVGDMAIEAQAEVLRQQEAKTLQGIQSHAEAVEFNATLRAQAERALKGPMADKLRKKELSRTMEMYGKAYRQGDFATALRYLEQARTVAKNIIENPQGDYIGRRNALPEHAREYGEAVRVFLDAIGKIPEAASRALDGRENVDTLVQKMKAAVASVVQQFDSLLFVESAKRLSESGQDAKAIRALRERTLQRIRQQRDVMKADQVLQALLDNPLEPLRAAFDSVEKRLVSFEANVRRCVQ